MLKKAFLADLLFVTAARRSSWRPVRNSGSCLRISWRSEIAYSKLRSSTAVTTLSQSARSDSLNSFSVLTAILAAQLITKRGACVSLGQRWQLEPDRESSLVYNRSICGFCDSGIGLADFLRRRFDSASPRLELSKWARISFARSRISL